VRGSPGFSPERLRDARTQAGLSPAALARAAGTARSDIAKYEAGQASPQPPRLAAIALALGVPAGSLLELPPDGPGLAHLRAAAGLTQAVLAGRAGIGLKRYELAELGMRPLSAADAARIAAATSSDARQVQEAHQRDTARRRLSAEAPDKRAGKNVSDTLQLKLSDNRTRHLRKQQPDPAKPVDRDARQQPPSRQRHPRGEP
jgi:transcriptional regulator with XRE-family HTH domain